jgi:S1-C subfamily serine protease
MHCACFGEKRSIPYADAVPFLGIENAAKAVKKAVFAVQIHGNQKNADPNDDWLAIGSGFLLRGDKKTVLGVTCRHVISAAIKAKKTVFIGLDTEKGYRRFSCRIAHVDPIDDIAVIIPKKPSKEDIKLQQMFFPEKLFDDNSALIEGRGVIIPGYPLSLGIEDDRNHPVIRFGIIAQFTGKKIFLIDGVASHGNSGSPVFALKHREQKLVGMITSHVADNIILFNESGKVSAKLPYNSGLARAITMKAIIEALKKVKY